jgi:chromosomal replication initiation ATPase DnaA
MEMMLLTQIMNATAQKYSTTAQAIRAKGSQRHLVSARREIASELRRHGWSYPRIGKALGGRHHTTIIYLLAGADGPTVEQRRWERYWRNCGWV